MVGRAQQPRRRDWSFRANPGDHPWLGGAVYWAQFDPGSSGAGVCPAVVRCPSPPSCGGTLQGWKRYVDALLNPCIGMSTNYVFRILFYDFN